MESRRDSISRVGLLFSLSTKSRISVESVEPEEKEKEAKSRFDSTQWVTLLTLAFGNFCVGACVSLQAPFFPKEAESKGATPTEYGLIFGVYELTVFISAPIMGKLVGISEPKFLMNSGIFMVGVTCMCFGLLDLISDHMTFVALAFVIRILEGVGAAASQTACFVIIAGAFPNNMATTFALLETFIGLGLITGPTLGGALFDVGGFGLPFYVMGSLMVLNSIIILVMLPRPERKRNQEEGNWMKFWLHPITMIYVIIVFSSFNYIGYNHATLEPHLRQFSLSGVFLGLVFALPGSLYAVSAPFWGWLCDKKIDAKMICIAGCLITVVSLLLIGPMPFLHLETSLGIVLSALCLKGIALGAKLVCAFSGSLTDTIERGFPQDVTTYGLVSSMFASAQSLGAFVGPSLGGYLLENLGYDYGTFVVFTFEIVVMLILIVYAAASAFMKSQRKKDSEKQPILANGEHSSYS